MEAVVSLGAEGIIRVFHPHAARRYCRCWNPGSPLDTFPSVERTSSTPCTPPDGPSPPPFTLPASVAAEEGSAAAGWGLDPRLALPGWEDIAVPWVKRCRSCGSWVASIAVTAF